MNIEPRQAETDALHAEFFPDRTAQNGSRPMDATGNGLTDDEVMVQMLTSRKAEAIQKLIDGNAFLIGDGSHSAADLAYCSHLAYWTDREAAQMDRLFRASRLFRAKWDESRGDTTYGAQTIAKAIAGTREGYRPKGEVATRLEPGESATYSLADFLAEVDDAPAVLIGDRDNVILRPETLAILTGPPKALKTAQVFEMALAIANGHPLYGQFPVPSAGPVLLIILESSRHLWRERFRALSMQRGVDPSKVVVRFIKGRPGLVSDADRSLILQAIEETRPVLTIIDTLGRASAGIDLNNASEVTPLFAWMERVRDQHHTGFLLVHHANKNSDGTPEQGIGGSTAIFAGVDTWLSSVRVGKMEDKRVRVSIVHRDGEEPTPFVLKLKGSEDRTDGLDPVPPWLQFEGSSKAAPNPLRRLILAYFDNGVTKATIKQLVDEGIGTRSRLQIELTALVTQGFLLTTETTEGKGGAKVYVRTSKPDRDDDSPEQETRF